MSARHSAWLHAVPKIGSGQSENRKSRLAILERGRIAPIMPEVTAEYLLGFFWEVGPIMAGGMSGAPLTNQELGEWQENTGIELAPWEARALIQMSRQYLAESGAATDQARPAPYQCPQLGGLENYITGLVMESSMTNIADL